MQSKTAQEFKTVYQADVGYLRKTLASGVLCQQIVDRIAQHFKGHMLRVDARIIVEGAATFSVSDVSLTDFEAVLGKMNVYSIIDIKMRLSESCLDRWLEWPIGKGLLTIPTDTPFGFRLRCGEQADVAVPATGRPYSRGFDGAATTHIYIPSTDNKEIPIYPCEPFGVKKVDLKSSSQTDLGKAEVEPQSEPAKADLKSRVATLVVEWEAQSGRPLSEFDYEDYVAFGSWLKAAEEPFEVWSAWMHLGEGHKPDILRALGILLSAEKIALGKPKEASRQIRLGRLRSLYRQRKSNAPLKRGL